MNKKISIYIVEDYNLARITCKKALEQFPDLEVKEAFETAEECITALEKEKVDIILMDIGLPYMTGIEATRIIKEKYPEIKTIMLTSHDNKEEIISSIASGANAYALKEISIEDLHTAIIETHKGCIWIHSKIASIINNTFINTKNEIKDENTLTNKEKEILTLMAEGFSLNEIAQKITINSESTKAIIYDILEKLSVTDRVKTAIEAIKYDL